MTEPTIREVEEHNLLRALTLLDAVGTLNLRTQAVTTYTLQIQISTISEDMIAYAKELIKTPPPAVDAPLVSPAAE